LVGMIIRHYEKDVGRRSGFLTTKKNKKTQ